MKKKYKTILIVFISFHHRIFKKIQMISEKMEALELFLKKN